MEELASSSAGLLTYLSCGHGVGPSVPPSGAETDPTDVRNVPAKAVDGGRPRPTRPCPAGKRAGLRRRLPGSWPSERA
eukprot:10650272-Heterocapsa_arctica.AAC.1